MKKLIHCPGDSQERVGMVSATDRPTDSWSVVPGSPFVGHLLWVSWRVDVDMRRSIVDDSSSIDTSIMPVVDR